MKTNDFMNEIDIPAGLELRLETLIDRLDKEDKQAKRKTKQVRLWAGSIAASIVVLISAGFYIHSSGKMAVSDNSQTATISESEIAYREAEKALVLVSRNFNKGMSQLAIVSNEIEKANKTLDKTFKHLKR
jgi:Ni,Fe-hydrogenase I cytochrome b subunit